MMPAQAAIARLRRDLALGTLLNVLLAGVALLALVLPLGVDLGFWGMLLLGAVLVVWMALNAQSVRNSRLAAQTPALIASGELEAAEAQIEQSLRTFSLHRASKLMALHQLAMLRRAQERWGDCAQLCRALLGQKLNENEPLAHTTRLLLAEALLELDDPKGAQEAMGPLYRQRLSLGAALSLLPVQLDYQARVGAWESMVEGVGAKARLSEVMSAGRSARVQALLSMAARKPGRMELSGWLKRRAELLADVNELTRWRGVLWEVWGR